ncbi:MAG: MerR family transcriptional regulator [Chitinophagales bacterium]
MSKKKSNLQAFGSQDKSDLEKQMHFDFPKNLVSQAKGMKKRYYSIGEVAEMFDVNASLLRYWETEFSILKPKKNRQGNRLYTEKDVETVRLIHNLVKERGYTLEGAKNKLKENRDELENRQKVIKTLKNIRTFLVEMRNLVDNE